MHSNHAATQPSMALRATTEEINWVKWLTSQEIGRLHSAVRNLHSARLQRDQLPRKLLVPRLRNSQTHACIEYRRAEGLHEEPSRICRGHQRRKQIHGLCWVDPWTVPPNESQGRLKQVNACLGRWTQEDSQEPKVRGRRRSVRLVDPFAVPASNLST